MDRMGVWEVLQSRRSWWWRVFLGIGMTKIMIKESAVRVEREVAKAWVTLGRVCALGLL